jgi:hypothetical protein
LTNPLRPAILATVKLTFPAEQSAVLFENYRVSKSRFLREQVSGGFLFVGENLFSHREHGDLRDFFEIFLNELCDLCGYVF